jgi:hypothetical protein
MAFHNDIDAFVFRDAKGRARHSVRAALGQTHDGAHGVTRPTRLIRAEIVVICHGAFKNKIYPNDLPHPNPLPPGEGRGEISPTTSCIEPLNHPAHSQTQRADSFSPSGEKVRMRGPNYPRHSNAKTLRAFLPLPAGAATAPMAGEGENHRKPTATTYLKPL